MRPQCLFPFIKSAVEVCPPPKKTHCVGAASPSVILAQEYKLPLLCFKIDESAECPSMVNG